MINMVVKRLTTYNLNIEIKQKIIYYYEIVIKEKNNSVKTIHEVLNMLREDGRNDIDLFDIRKVINENGIIQVQKI